MKLERRKSMSNFILEEELNNVKSEKTKEYLKEVISTYYNGNYRSCIVSLYAVTIYDFIDKLTKLKEIYSDKKAEAWLQQIDSMQNADEKYSDIENKVMDAILDIQILNPIECEQVKSLRIARNHAAHPVLQKQHPVQIAKYMLLNPTKEQTISNIRNMFDAVFNKDIVLSKKILKEFREDICDFYERQPNLNGLSVFIHDKYYKRFSIIAKEYLFNELWKYAFVFDDEDCNKNRKVIVETLIYFLENDKLLYIDYFKKNKESLYSKIDLKKALYEKNSQLVGDWWYKSKVDNMYGSPIKALIYFLKRNPEFYGLAPGHIKISIKNKCMSDINFYLFSDFISETKGKHIIDVFDKIKADNFRNPCLNESLLLSEYKESKKLGIDNIMREKISWYYSHNTYCKVHGCDFHDINNIFSRILTHILEDYSSEELQNLLELIGNRSHYKDANTNDTFKDQINKIVNTNNMNIDLTKYIVMN